MLQVWSGGAPVSAVANILRVFSFLGGLLAAAVRVWYQLAFVRPDPFFMPASGSMHPNGLGMMIDLVRGRPTKM